MGDPRGGTNCITFPQVMEVPVLQWPVCTAPTDASAGSTTRAPRQVRACRRPRLVLTGDAR